jgi:hypothetical protein
MPHKYEYHISSVFDIYYCGRSQPLESDREPIPNWVGWPGFGTTPFWAATSMSTATNAATITQDNPKFLEARGLQTNNSALLGVAHEYPDYQFSFIDGP